MFTRILCKEGKIKMKKKYLLSLLVLLVTSCDRPVNITDFNPKEVKTLNTVSKPVNQQNVTSEIDHQYITNLIEFSCKFAGNAFNNESRVFSPLSIYNCYAMLYEGTTNNVREDMNRLFNYDSLDSLKNSIKTAMEIMSIDDEYTKLDTANSFWVDDEFKDYVKQDYLDVLADYYYAEAFGGKLESSKARKDMANWINHKTNNMFDVKEDNFRTSSDTVLALLNTLYLKCPWLEDFNENLNYIDEFNSYTGSSSKTFMTKTNTGYIYSGENFDVANILLKENGLNFRILLPHEGENSIEVLKNNVDSIFDLSSLEKTRYRIVYNIPQFKIKTKYDLKTELLQIGLTKPFQWTNDYTNIVDFQRDDQLFCVSQSIHEAGIDVNNDGIEAAAYTTIIMDTGAAPAPIELPVFEFNANRPFMYALTYQNIPLFLGNLLA